MDIGERSVPPRRPYRRWTTAHPSGPGSAFAERLNRLFAIVHPPGRGPYSSNDLIRAVNARGIMLSAPYLSQLRTGQRNCPSANVIDAISDFFGVHPYYFTNEEHDYTRNLDRELYWLDLAHNPTVRDVTTALLSLPPEVRDDLLETGNRELP